VHSGDHRAPRQSAGAAVIEATAIVARRQLPLGLPRRWNTKTARLRAQATDAATRPRTASGRAATPAAENQLGIANCHQF
jgi:hypothetical protein